MTIIFKGDKYNHVRFNHVRFLMKHYCCVWVYSYMSGEGPYWKWTKFSTLMTEYQVNALYLQETVSFGDFGASLTFKYGCSTFYI